MSALQTSIYNRIARLLDDTTCLRLGFVHRPLRQAVSQESKRRYCDSAVVVLAIDDDAQLHYILQCVEQRSAAAADVTTLVIAIAHRLSKRVLHALLQWIRRSTAQLRHFIVAQAPPGPEFRRELRQLVPTMSHLRSLTSDFALDWPLIAAQVQCLERLCISGAQLQAICDSRVIFPNVTRLAALNEMRLDLFSSLPQLFPACRSLRLDSSFELARIANVAASPIWCQLKSLEPPPSVALSDVPLLLEMEKMPSVLLCGTIGELMRIAALLRDYRGLDSAAVSVCCTIEADERFLLSDYDALGGDRVRSVEVRLRPFMEDWMPGQSAPVAAAEHFLRAGQFRRARRVVVDIAGIDMNLTPAPFDLLSTFALLVERLVSDDDDDDCLPALRRFHLHYAHYLTYDAEEVYSCAIYNALVRARRRRRRHGLLPFDVSALIVERKRKRLV